MKLLSLNQFKKQLNESKSVYTVVNVPKGDPLKMNHFNELKEFLESMLKSGYDYNIASDGSINIQQTAIDKDPEGLGWLISLVNENDLTESLSYSDLVIGKEYNWLEGAEPLKLKYIGLTKDYPEIKIGSSVGKGFLFQWENGSYMEMSNPTIRKSLTDDLEESVLNEVEAKDITRIEDIKRKSNGDIDKMKSLATTMSKLITDKYKALNRGLAAKEVLGNDDILSDIFFDRAKELQIDDNLIPKKINKFSKLFGDSTGGKVLGSDINDTTLSTKRQRGYILSCGSLKIDSGENKWFNIYENNPEGTLEIWKKFDGKLVAISTAGKPSRAIGTGGDFYNDQTARPMFNATLVDYVEIKDAKALIPKYGKSIIMYVYK